VRVSTAGEVLNFNPDDLASLLVDVQRPDVNVVGDPDLVRQLQGVLAGLDLDALFADRDLRPDGLCTSRLLSC
jgi:hypothetical protein